MVEKSIIIDVEKKVKSELEMYKDKELNIEVLTKILNIPLIDVKNILGVEK